MKKTLSTIFVALLIAGATSVKAQDAKIKPANKIEKKAVTTKKARKQIKAKDIQVQKIQTSSTKANTAQPVKVKGIAPKKSATQPKNGEKAVIKNLNTTKPISNKVKKAKLKEEKAK